MARLVTVRFLRGAAPYNTGEIAGFDASVARALIEGGAAEAIKAAPSLPATAAGPEARKRVALTFIAAAPPYHAGDVAGFEALEAAALVARGKAVPLAARTAATAAGEDPAEEEACDAEDPAADPDAQTPADEIDDAAAPELDFVIVDPDDDGAPPVQGRAG